MLENIHVKNIALIKEIDINLGRGLNIVTGETGAGKSLIIGSIAIGLGAKVSKDFIGKNEDEALIELTFTDINENVRSLLNNNDIDVEDIVIIQRRIGKSRTVNRINYSTVSLNFLREVGEKLLQIHGQHDNHTLIKKETHIKILDSFAKDEIAPILTTYREKYNNLVNISNELKNYDLLRREKLRDEDYLKFVVDEIDESKIIIGEDEKLREEYNNLIDLQNSSDVLHSINENLDDVVNSKISDIISKLGNLVSFDSSLNNLVSMMYDADAILQECHVQIKNLIDNLDFSEEEFNRIDSRIDLLDRLKRKYGGTLQSVLDYLKESKEKLLKMEDLDKRIQQLKDDGIKLKEEVHSISEKLHEIRNKNAKEFEEKIKKSLEELNFAKVDFSIKFEKAKKLLANGQDEVEMYISTNVGYGLKPLTEVASGGELARIMLAIEAMASERGTIGTLIFDEVDSGISGKTGMMVAKRLIEMSVDKQIICITHLPQIASAGNINFKIDKKLVDGKTHTQLDILDEEGKVNEVARLLSGIDITQNSINSARELIKQLTLENGKE